MELGDREAIACLGGRADKLAVNYRPGDIGRRCSSCDHFVNWDQCFEVAGDIDSHYVCDLFKLCRG
jgi:hypothetical protein